MWSLITTQLEIKGCQDPLPNFFQTNIHVLAPSEPLVKTSHATASVRVVSQPWTCFTAASECLTLSDHFPFGNCLALSQYLFYFKWTYTYFYLPFCGTVHNKLYCFIHTVWSTRHISVQLVNFPFLFWWFIFIYLKGGNTEWEKEKELLPAGSLRK